MLDKTSHNGFNFFLRRHFFLHTKGFSWIFMRETFIHANKYKNTGV